jgi:Xaa-Pro aminopeptidase
MFESRFQTFTETADPSQGAARVAQLRAELDRRGLEGFIVPRADEHQNEYVPRSAERLAWLTGFTGSAGLAIVLKTKAAIFVDGRYTLQVSEQVDGAVFSPQPLADVTPESWLEANLRPSWRLGYDPWLHTPAQVKRIEAAAKAAGASLVAVRVNPIDAIWLDRPRPPQGAVVLHPKRYSGEEARSKLARVARALGKADALLVSDPHAVAWAFNIRGHDLAHTPIALAYCLIPATGRPSLYIEPAKLSQSVGDELAALAEIAEPAALLHDLERLGGAHRNVRFDAATVPAKLVIIFENAGGTADIGPDPIALMKATKNRVELAGTRAAHLRDGAALTRFLAWFDAVAAKGTLSEIDAAQALETFRRDTRKLKDISFPTIAASGPNAAIPHYRVTEASNRRIGPGIFLIDSGAQYQDGTTDVTRTLCVGKPTPEMRDRFTRVLKGHIAIATATFPKGTSGAQIDAFARRALWEAGLDFDHGTGHGVGSYLSVHEGPQRISKLGATALQPGMIVSNEPGYYKSGAWGIRIENLVVVEPRKIAGAEHEMLGFETITLAPIALALVDAKLMSKQEIDWLDAYHMQVRKALSPLVESGVRTWLAQATRAIGKTRKG